MHASDPPPLPPRAWITILFLAGTFVLGTIGTVLVTLHVTGFAWWMPALLVGTYAIIGLGVCAGYHRHYAHPSHHVIRAVEWFYLVAGACALQREVGQWASSHRLHHRFTDTDRDPYDISKGFWWAHVGWVCRKFPDIPLEEWPRDLRENPLVLWQRRWYFPIAFGLGIGIPVVIGWLCGSALAGLFWGGITRIVLIHHSTFFVNSLAHMVGSRPYSLKESARDNAVVAFLALGEGFHNFHHAFQMDWRNGIRWFHFDPAKWFIGTLAKLRLAEIRFTTPQVQIERKRLAVSRELAERRTAAVDPAIAARVGRHLARAERLLAHSLHRRRSLRRALLRRAHREQRAALRLVAA